MKILTWAQRKLKDLTDVRDGTHSSPKYVEAGHPFITSKNINNGSIDYRDIKYITDEDFDEINKRSKVDIHDILMGMIGTVGNLALIDKKPNFAIKNIALIKDIGKIDYLFLYNFLQSNYVSKELIQKLDGGTQKFISLNKVRDLNISVASFQEQKAISKCLMRVNNLLILQQRKAQQLKLLKKAMMQDLFNDRDIPKLRFSGFKDNWSNVNLGEIGKATGGTPLESEFIKNGSYKVISIGSYTENHKYNNQGMRVNLNRKTKKRIMNKDDLAMILNDKTKSGKIIGSVLLISDNDSFVYNQRTERIEPNHDKFSSQFLFQYLNANTIRNKIVSNAQGNTQIYVNWSSISKINYLIPSIDEQKRIGKLLFSLDSIIDIQQGKIEKYYKVKQFLLQNMFI